MAKTKDEPQHGEKPEERKAEINMGLKLGGFLGSVTNLIEKLGELAETGKELRQTGEISGLEPTGRLRGVYGFSVKTGLGKTGEEEVQVEPFGNIHVPRERPGEAVVEETREPLVDIHHEEDHVLVLAEIPGVSKEDVRLALSGDVLDLSAQRGEHRYHKQVRLPERLAPEQMRWDCNNGILRIRLQREK